MLNPHDSTSQSKDGGVEFYFPDEIAIEILSRLPAIDVVRLRCVCKRWRDLTCTHNFMLLHLRRCLPMVLSQRFIDDSGTFRGYEHYLLDRWWEPLQTTPNIYQLGKLSEYELCFSHGGLVVMEKFGHYTIMNPVHHEKVRITVSLGNSEIYGVFFHPSLKEVCTLWRWRLGVSREYKTLTLGSKPCWRDLNNPWSHIDRVSWIPPVLIDEHLYWLVKPKTDCSLGVTLPPDIMEFDIRNEEFDFISSPMPGAYKCNMCNINLIDIGGLLSLVQTSSESHRLEINIWTLKDRARKLWTMSSYRINTCPFSSYWTPMALVNDELVLSMSGNRYFPATSS